MTERRRWVRHTATKVPLRVDGRGAASSTAPGTWSSYREAVRSRVGVGIGYVLAAGDGIVCVDLDHCIDAEGRVAEWAQAILDRCPPTFVEVSMSGTGLHVWGRGHLTTAIKVRRGEVAIEVYGAGRYIAMGRRWRGAPLELVDLSDVISGLC